MPLQVEQVAREKARRQGRHAAYWSKHADLYRFLQDFEPAIADRVRECGKHLIEERRVDDRRVRRLRPIRPCRVRPWCHFCSEYTAYRRVSDAMKGFQRCTPAGEKPRFIHIVQVAPHGRDGQYKDGSDWGRHACRNVKAFRGVVWRALEDLYGPGIGGIASYQDFGEEGFAKRHPHVDLTLNGWQMGDEGQVKTKRYQLGGNGRERWEATVQARASRFIVNPARGSFNLEPARVGVRPYWHTLEYQMREMIDVRKLQYSREGSIVYWKSEKYGTRQKFVASEWYAGYIEYSDRLRQFRGHGQSGLHASHGHMAKRSIRKTQLAMGGEVRHDSDCGCRECAEWEPVGRPMASVS